MASFMRNITPVLIISTQSHIQLVLNEVWTSFTVSQETPPGRGQAPHWRNLIIGHQLWSIILVNLSTTASHQIPHETAALLTIFSATDTHIHRGVAWHPSVSLMMSTEPREEHGEEWRTRGENTKCSLCFEDLSFIHCSSVQEQHSVAF